MKDIIIFGAGGLGREVQWLIECINSNKSEWKFLGYIDDGIEAGTIVNGYPVLGGTEVLNHYDSNLSIVCAVACSTVRKKIIERIKEIGKFNFPTIIHPSVIMSDSVSLGEGNIICAGNILTVDVDVRDFSIINPGSTIGHDVKIESYVTVYPGVNISGNVKIQNLTEIGTGTKIIQGLTIGKDVIVGAGTVIIEDVPDDCTVVGVPARKVKSNNERK